MKVKFDKQLSDAKATFMGNNAVGEALVSDDFFNQLLNYSLERGFLYTAIETGTDSIPGAANKYNMGWAKINRLPVHPSVEENFDLLSKWQSTLSVAHMLNYKIVFNLQRYEGRTSLYVGAVSNDGYVENNEAIRKVQQSATIHMPGIGMNLLDKKVARQEVLIPMDMMSYSGIVTGIPSSRSSGNVNLLQTLDKLAFGVREEYGLTERNYNLIVIADPVSDIEITDLMGTLFNLQSEIHDKVLVTASESFTESNSQFSSKALSLNLGSIILGLCTAAACVATGGLAVAAIPAALQTIANPNSNILSMMGLNICGSLSGSKGKSRSFSTSNSVSRQYLNSVAQYCEQTIQRHIKRLEKGRNLGYWNTGIYVLADQSTTVDYVLGMLRSVYAGDETYVEPIRAFNMGNSTVVCDHIRYFSHVPLPVSSQVSEAAKKSIGREDSWHILGPLYQSFTTPLNTEELSIATSLPRRDVPGLKFVRNAVKFAANPPTYMENADLITLGFVVDTGVQLDVSYRMDVNELVRHCLMCGITGSGKTTTTKKILWELMEKKIPFLVIEPAKTEYVDWAIKYNKLAEEFNRQKPSSKQVELINIYMPGIGNYEGIQPKTLRINPFEPCVTNGAPMNMMRRLDNLVAILKESIPMSDVLPVILEESLYELASSVMGEVAWQNGVPNSAIESYPNFGMVLKIVKQILKDRGYNSEIKGNIEAAMETRMNAMMRGWKEAVLNSPRSAKGDDLFGRNTVINLSGLSVNTDKSLLMSLLLLSLNEYRESKYYNDTAYKNQLKNGDKLMHFTVVEEAHRILSKSNVGYSAAENAQTVSTDLFCDMLSEIRAYGEGIMIVDQVPSKLVTDAIKNTNLKIVHKLVAKDDRDTVGACMGLRDEQKGLIAVLDKGHAIVCSEQDDAALWVKIEKKNI